MSNEHWKLLSAGGRIVSLTPQDLWEQAVSYFQWVDDNPITVKKTMLTGKTQGQKFSVEYKRPYTIDAFCLHASITKTFLLDIQSMYGKNSEWYNVAEKIISIIYTDNLEGAIVDLYNPIVVSKLLNLDKPRDDEGKAVKVEIVDTRNKELYTNENDIIRNLDFNKVQQFNSKLTEEQLKEQDTVGRKEH